MTYEEMTVEQLNELSNQFSQQRAELKARHMELVHVLDRKLTLRNIAAKLSEQEIRILIGASGVASGEAIGSPGAA